MNTREFQRKIRFIKEVEQDVLPSSAWILKTRETLLMQVGNGMAQIPPPWWVRTREFWLHFVPSRLIASIRGPVIAVFSVISIVAGGSIASVSAAEQALPGDFLYGVKLATEQTRLVFAKGKTEKIKLKTDFVGRRVEEIRQISASDVSEKPKRIREAAQILKRDLDTVKTQLTEVSSDEQKDVLGVGKVTETAKLIDQKSDELTASLKEVKETIPFEVQDSVAEAESAALATGVQAVQVLIDTHVHPEAQDIVTTDELTKSIQGKVDGMREQISNAVQKILNASSSSTMMGSLPDSTTGTPALLTDPFVTTPSSSSSLAQVKDANSSLDQAWKLLEESKFEEAGDKLGEASKAVSSVEKTAGVVAMNAAASSTAAAMNLPTPTVNSTASGTSDVLDSSNPTPTSPTLKSKASSTDAVEAPGG